MQRCSRRHPYLSQRLSESNPLSRISSAVSETIRDDSYEQRISSSYEILCPNVIPKGFMDGKAASQKMVDDSHT